MFLVTLQRHAKAREYFWPERFTGRVEDSALHELALNPDGFTGRTDEEILSTLAHEMAHVWQQTHGKPPTRCYHDRQWAAAKMKRPACSRRMIPANRETGQSVTHYIVPGGPYARAYARLKATGFQLHWQSASRGSQAKAKRSSKTHTCPECGQNARAKADALLICGNSYEDGEGARHGSRGSGRRTRVRDGVHLNTAFPALDNRLCALCASVGEPSSAARSKTSRKEPSAPKCPP